MRPSFLRPPEPRFVPAGEHPLWDEALATVNRDLAATLPGQRPLCLIAYPADAHEDEQVYVALADGNAHGNSLQPSGSAPWALWTVAEAAQDTITGCLWQACRSARSTASGCTCGRSPAARSGTAPATAGPATRPMCARRWESWTRCTGLTGRTGSAVRTAGGREGGRGRGR
ncbi:hypothetical protein [Streptomyces olivaceoviridis]|uniref:hypothetical protein n=1 Tax=Streptomyces olivaceoviridis TaxID=1921 RepID=UPI00331A347E